MKINILKPIVKRYPRHGEQHLLFEIREYNVETGKCLIAAVNSGHVSNPEEIVDINELQNL